MKLTERGADKKSKRKSPKAMATAHVLANEMMHGERAVTVTARLAITQGGGQQIKDLTKIMAGFAGFTSSSAKISTKEYEVWDCDIIIVPKRIYRNGPFKGHRLSQVVTELGGDIGERFASIEEIEL